MGGAVEAMRLAVLTVSPKMLQNQAPSTPRTAFTGARPALQPSRLAHAAAHINLNRLMLKVVQSPAVGGASGDTDPIQGYDPWDSPGYWQSTFPPSSPYHPAYVPPISLQSPQALPSLGKCSSQRAPTVRVLSGSEKEAGTGTVLSFLPCPAANASPSHQAWPAPLIPCEE